MVSPDEGEHQAGAGARDAAAAPSGDRRQAARERRRDQAGKHHRRRGVKDKIALDVRRHDQHGQLDLRRGQGDSPVRRPRDPRRRHARRARAARPSSACRKRRSKRVIITDTIPLPAAARRSPRSRSFPSPRSWARRSSASTATNRSAGCSSSMPGPGFRTGDMPLHFRRFRAKYLIPLAVALCLDSARMVRDSSQAKQPL